MECLFTWLDLMANSRKTNLIDKTIANLWKAWDELSISTAHYISGKPRPDLPQDDLIKVMAEVADCIKGKSDEASLRARAAAIGKTYLELNEDGRSKFLRALAADFDVDRQIVDEKIELVKNSSDNKSLRLRAEEELKIALQPTWRVLLGRFTTLPEGVKFLVDMRTEMLSLVKSYPEIKILSNDLRSMLSAWFDIGLLELVQINWGSPASLLEKLIAYESVHAVRSWSDLKNRLGPNRRCFGFFHPNMPNEPLIFVQVALVEGISNNIEDLLDESKSDNNSIKADTAVFYSISNAQRGLDGISFGNFLIKTVVEKLSTETPNLRTFATLSPIPGFANWLNEQIESRQDNLLKQSEKKNLAKYTTHFTDADILEDLLPKLNEIEKGQQKQLFSELEAPLTRLAAEYICNIRNNRGRAIDPVAHFHLSNGASVYRLNWAADTSIKGKAQSYGLMVNYEYNLKEIQINSSVYEAEKKVAASSLIKNILKK
jgi:malonyl-CoA decarboxylase